MEQFFGDPQCVAAFCGGPHQRCCGSGCNGPDLVCSGFECVPCGDAGEPCCGDNSCSTGNDCSPITHQCAAHLPVGGPCASDTDCGGGGLVCDHSVEGGMCTRGCDPSRTGTCGPGAICSPLRRFTDAAGFTWAGSCLASCDSRDGSDPAVCRNATVCGAPLGASRYWEPDHAVCLPFCSIDPDCPPGLRCNHRTGSCGNAEVVDLTRAPDGEPCDRSDPAACRGTCFDVGGPRGRGICGSLIDTTFTHECPDDPTMPIFASGPELGFCVHRSCTFGCDCPEGLVCSHRPELYDACTYSGSNPDLEDACTIDGGADADAASDATDESDDASVSMDAAD